MAPSLSHSLLHPLAAASDLPPPARAAAASEALLLLTHAKVLFGIGPSYSFQELQGRRAYFVFDLLSPWLALAAARRAAPAALLAVLAAHAALHAFYVATWRTRHTERVLHLSTTHEKGRWGRGYGTAELLWYWAGTSFDIATHAAMLWLLFS